MVTKTHNFKLVNGDTDSIAFTKPDQSVFTNEEQSKLLNELNGLMDDGIYWDNDGTFNLMAIIAAKNYIMFDGKKIKIKGSGLKATKKEPRLKKMITDIIDCIVHDRIDEILYLYMTCAKEIISINMLTDVTPWSFKATATKAVLAPTTPFNHKINDALTRNRIDIVEGDKYYFFFKNISEIKTIDYINKKGKPAKKRQITQGLEMIQHFNGDIDKAVLLKKLFSTIKIFNRVLDISKYPNFNLKSNKLLLEKLSTTKHIPS